MGQEKKQGPEGKALETLQEKIGDNPVEDMHEKTESHSANDYEGIR